MAIRNPNIRTLAEPEDDFEADEAFLRNLIAPTPAPAPAPVAPAPFNPVGFDWATQGTQNIGGTIYQPQFESVQLGHGEEGGQYGQGALQNVLRYKEGQTGPGQTYEIIDPTTGKVTGTGKFKENSKGFFGDLFSMVGDAAKDVAPLASFALGVGPLGGMLGGSIAGALGIPVATATSAGLTAAQVAALGSAAGGAGITALQGGDLGDVLKGAVTTALPSFVLPNIPSTGTPIIDKAIQAGTQAAIRGGDIESSVVGSLLNSGVGAAIGETGLDPKLVNSIISAATSGGDPQKLFNAAVGAAGSFGTTPKAQNPSAGYGGADPGYFDEQNEVIGLPAWAIDPYAEPVDNEMAKFLRQQELAQTGESPLGGMGLNAKELPLINLSGTPAPAAAPGKAPAPAAPKGSSFNPAALFGLAALLGQQQQEPQEQYQTARTVASPFGMDLIL